MSESNPGNWAKFGKDIFNQMIDISKDERGAVHPGNYCLNFRVTQNPDGRAAEMGETCCVNTRQGQQCGSC